MDHWNAFLRVLEEKLGKEAVDRWIKPFKVCDYDAKNLYLEAADPFQAHWFEEQIRPLCKTHFLDQNQQPIKVHIRVPGTQKGSSRKAAPTPLPIELRGDNLDKNATFENFICTEENKLLVELLKTLPNPSYNPVYLFGSAGVGKSHLLMAAAQHLAAKGLKALYVHASTFTDHVVQAIRSSQMQHLRTRYRAVDALIIDDIHILARKNATQEEFFHTFNALHSRGKQIILSAKEAPSQLEDIEPRLTSRFEWGVFFEVHPLGLAELCQVLRQRCRLLQFPLSDEGIAFLAQNFSGNLAALMQAFEALILRSAKRSFSLTKEEIEGKIGDLIALEKAESASPEKIISATAAYFGIRVEDILGKSQGRQATLPRQIALYLCRNKLKLPFQALGRLFGRDHSTVMTSIKQIEEKKLKGGEISTALLEIEKALALNKKNK